MPHHIHPTPFIIHPPEDLVTKQPGLRRLAFSLALKYASKQVVTEEDLQMMGGALWSVLGLDDEFELAYQSAGAAILPIAIESGAADVQALPWETLFHPAHGFIGKNPAFTLTRQLSAGKDAVSPLEQGPLRVLLFTSLPEDVDPEKGRLNVEEEQAQVQEALLPWISKGLVKLEMPDDGRFESLKELLGKFQPQILFLSGHGRFHHEPHTGEPPYGEFLFESEIGDSDPIREDEIAKALVGIGVQAVILSACESSKASPASDALNNGLARRISALGIPHVVGMRESIYDKAGIKFARTLCDELAQRERMDAALQAARIAIQTPFRDIARREADSGLAEELSFGQWCLPMLLSSNPQSPLIDWDFTPRAAGERSFIQTLSTVSLPARFVGRRAEMRKYKNDLLRGKIQKLLITGPGGQGKTSLAGKLALDLRKRGYEIFAWSARPENPWREFEFEMELALEESRAKKYDHFRPHFATDAERAKFLLEQLMEQFDGRVILFLDNLESIQDPKTLEVNHATVAAWIRAAQALAGLTLFTTSRWKLPGWDGEHLPLDHANYGDFLQMAQGLGLPTAFLQKRDRLRRVYKVLAGNPRGLEFFAAAVKGMQAANEEDAFLDALAEVKADLQANMAIEAIYKQLPADAQTLLRRLPAYHEPVPLEGLLKLGLAVSTSSTQRLPDPEALLERLLAVSLLEAGYEPHWQVAQYQCAPLVSDWMGERGLVDTAPEYLNAAADYHLYLRRYERRTLSQTVTAHHALRRAGRDTEADRLTLNAIVGPLTMAGFYAALLTEWLPRICTSQDLKTRAEALGQTGKILHHLGDFQNALPFMKQSLAIQQQIGDKAGEGTTLNNISQIFQAQGDYETALGYLKQSLAIQQQIGNIQGESVTLNNISNIYQAQGDYATALEYSKKDLAICQKIGDKAGEGTTLNNISALYHAQGDYETALGYLKQSLTIRQQIGDKAGEGTTLNNISQIFKAQGDYETALGYLKQSLAIQQQIGDKAGEGTTLNNISQIFQAQGDYETALGYLKQSLTIRQQIGDKAGEGTTLGNIANLYHAQGDYETSISYMKQSLVIFQQIGDKAKEGTTLNNISQIYSAQGDYETALGYLKQSLAIQQQIGDKAGEAATLGNIGTSYHAQGDYETALGYLKQSLTIRQQIGDKAGEGTTLNNISQIFKAQGDYETALGYLKQSLAIQQQIGDKAGEAATLGNIGTSYHAQGDYETALGYLKQSLTIRQQIGDKAGEGTTLNNISQIFKAQGDYETALGYLKQSLTIRQQIGDKAGYCVTLFNMGHIYAQNKQMQEAAQAWVTVYTIAKPMGLANVLQALSQLAPQLGLPEGLTGWEQLVQRMQSGEKLEFAGERKEESESEQVREFVHGVVLAAREKKPEAQKYFEAVSKMAADPEAPPEFRELGKVLQKYMTGIKNPDLSQLPEELATIVREELEN